MEIQQSKKPGSQRYYGWTGPGQPDIRDCKFTPRADIVAQALPPSIDLSAATLPAPWFPVWSQGSLGSCALQTVGADIVYAGLKQEVRTTFPMPSRLFMYYNCRLLMGTTSQDSGCSNRTLMKSLQKYGWALESLWPYADDQVAFRRQPTPAVYADGAKRTIKEYLAVQQDLHTMKSCLVGGDPFIFGFSVYESMEADQVTVTGVVPFPSGNNDNQVGGHDVLIVGYDDATGLFKFRNSWGLWGQQGYGFISYAYATHRQLAGDFWTVVHSYYDVAEPPVTPTPPTPTPLPTAHEFELGPFKFHSPAKAGDLVSSNFDINFPAKAGDKWGVTL